MSYSRDLRELFEFGDTDFDQSNIIYVADHHGVDPKHVAADLAAILSAVRTDSAILEQRYKNLLKIIKEF